jgi:DeoR/GlpR family transcriptional regulator of sugar metabolism
MKSAVRQHRVRQILESNDFVDVPTLCRELQTSESTIRRDLIALEHEGVLKRVYGGAIPVQMADIGYRRDFAWDNERMRQEKERIAGLAATLLENGETVILDGGSTVAAVAQRLRTRPLHIITNSLPIADIFAESPQIELTLTGGYVYPRLRAMVGPICERMLGTVRADALIMGICGVTEAGYGNNNTLVVGPELKMIEVARRVIVVTDHTKFGRSAMIPLAPLDMPDVLITDDGVTPEYRRMLESNAVQVLTV